MKTDREIIETLSVEKFRRLGIACCHRLGCDRRDKRLGQALKTLERSLGPPLSEKLRRDAFNAANSACTDLRRKSELDNAIACTVLCACESGPTSLLLGNFVWGLVKGERLSHTEAADIVTGMVRAVVDG